MGAFFALLLAALSLAPMAQAPAQDTAREEAAAPAADAKAAAKARAKGQTAEVTDTAAGQWGTSAAPAATPAATPADEAPGNAPEFEAEEQVATGKFLTALEVKPILSATKPSWVAVREYNGQDLVYFTQVLAWRCGLHQIRFAINDGAEEVLEMEPCYLDTASPAALKADTVLPYLAYPLGSVDTVALRLIFDDNTEDSASYDRASVLMP